MNSNAVIWNRISHNLVTTTQRRSNTIPPFYLRRQRRRRRRYFQTLSSSSENNAAFVTTAPIRTICLSNPSQQKQYNFFQDKYISPSSSSSRTFFTISKNNEGFYKNKRFSPIHPQRLLFATTTPNIDTAQQQQQQQEPQQPQTLTKEEEETLYQELKSLSSLLRQYDSAYYSPNATSTSSIIPDEEYDALAAREAFLCTTYPNLLQKLQTEESDLGKEVTRFGGRVGFVLPQSQKEEKNERKKRLHLKNAPMKSLENALDKEDVLAWLQRISKLILVDDNDKEQEKKKKERIEILGEPKLDGLSLSLRYTKTTKPNNAAADDDDDNNENKSFYKFTWGATRGDGTKGEDVSDAVLQMSCIPQLIHLNKTGTADVIPDVIEVRGEVILPNTYFQQLQQRKNKEEEHMYQFSNARNAASGILLRKTLNDDDDAKETKELRSNLIFYAYDMVTSSEEEKGVMHLGQEEEQSIKTGLEMRNVLNEMGFLVSNPIVVASPLLLSKEESEEVDGDNHEKDEELNKLLTYHETLSSLRQDQESTTTTKTSPPSPFDKIDYDIDGAVYKLTSLPLRARLGSSTRTPRWSIAHKFPPKVAITTLMDVKIQVGRKTGALTPVAILKPVSIGGVIVSRASLHNFDWAGNMLSSSSLSASANDDDNGDEEKRKIEKETVKRWGMVKRNATVVVSRAGDVIPQVLKLVDDYNPIDGDNNQKYHDIHDEDIDTKNEDEWISLLPPKTCPACNHTTIFERDSDEDDGSSEKGDDGNITTSSSSTSGRVLRCGGPQLLCPPRAVGALVHAYARDGLDVRGLSEARLEQLMEAGFVQFPCDLFYSLMEKKQNDAVVDENDVVMEECQNDDDEEETASPEQTRLEEIAELPGWGPKSSQNLAGMVQSVAEKGVPLSRFIYSLGIRHIGSHTSKLIASSYGTVSQFLSDLEDANMKQDAKKEDDHDLYVPFARLAGNDEKDLEGVKGIGPVMISSLISFSKEDALVKAAKDLAAAIRVHDDDTINDQKTNQNQNSLSRPWNGLTVVFTGSLPGGLTRSAAQDLAIEMLGAKSTPGSVSKSTDLVVEGDKGGKKVERARELGVEVMSGDEFILMAEEYRSR